jgi:hypothetical protein
MVPMAPSRTRILFFSISINFFIKKTGALSGFFLQNLFSAYLTSQQYGANHDSFKLYKFFKSSNILFFLFICNYLVFPYVFLSWFILLPIAPYCKIIVLPFHFCYNDGPAFNTAVSPKS